MAAVARPFNPTKNTVHPEPVPGASQLAALPFAAGVSGYLHAVGARDRTRVVLHRTLSRDGKEYLQQLSSYVGQSYDPAQAGRMNAVTTGIMGKTYALKKILRTKRYSTAAELLSDLNADMKAVGDNRKIEHVARSYLAVPMLSNTGDVVAILYADTFSINTFADDGVVDCIIQMCNEFCRIMDALTVQPLPGIKNYQLIPGRPVEDRATVYPHLQVMLNDKAVPRFKTLSSFNFEAGA